MSDMNDKVALITGASSGIGRATGEAFAARGAKVVLAARREHELATLTSEIESRGGRASFVVTDVAIAKDVERMVAHAIETFGRLDYAVNNAGIEGQLSGIMDLPEEEWDRVFNINLKGNFLCMKYEARAMLAGGHGGAIVNVGSVNSFLGFPTASAYVASKHGQIGLTTSVSAELAPQGIRVNLVCPGIIDTPMHHRLRGLVGNEIFDKVLLQRVHTRRAGRPDEIAQTIVFLCSDEASYISGTTLTPDGGFTLTV
ncbi:MAG TPA: glucose 1-dehydrogenase [Planctomycetaceae bacterium]|jgi:NAD(P)-dependent dehydrogenase (short-subunit alcohol dehydrogenase family)|nr:glucose 1-dehydrogenase [Planctomycetaceae bacterium]